MVQKRESVPWFTLRSAPAPSGTEDILKRVRLNLQPSASWCLAYKESKDAHFCSIQWSPLLFTEFNITCYNNPPARRSDQYSEDGVLCTMYIHRTVPELGPESFFAQVNATFKGASASLRI